jgi:hypothetical protein
MHFNKSESLKELAPALAKMMGQIGPAMKDTLNPHFGKKYVTLAGCHAVAIGPMRENGFSFPMFPSLDRENGVLTVTALLLHVSGEYLEGSISIPLPANYDAQKVLAAETYARRGLYCMVGVVPDDDDDGESLVARGNGQERRPEPRREPPAPTQKQRNDRMASDRDEREEPSARRPSEPPPKQLTEELADRGIANVPADDDTKPAKSNEMLDHALHEVFTRLKELGKNPQQLMMIAKEATGLHPNAWTVADGRKFLSFAAERFPQ